MKKITALLLAAFVLAAAAPAFADPSTDKEARYKAMKEIKDRQRAEREARKNAPQDPNTPREKSFWEKEGERSGLGQSGNGIGKFVRNLNPVPFFKDQDDKYKARKAQAQN